LTGSRHLVVTVNNALDLIEGYHGEVFTRDKFFVVRTSNFDIGSYKLPEATYETKICLMHSAFGRVVESDLSKFDLVIIVDDELLNEDTDPFLKKIANKLNNDKIIMITSGYCRNLELDRNRVYIYPFFLLNIPRHNESKNINSLVHHQKTFDVLLGMSKPHRKFIFDNIESSGLIDQCYVNLTSNRFLDESLYTIYRTPGLTNLETDESIKRQSPDVYDSYVHQPDEPRVSQYIPWEIYKNSLYSIVAETNYDNYYFFTEKTAKCLFARRLFVFFGSQGQLKDLREMGFMTFDSVIDESYDNISDNTERYSQAFQQVVSLSKSNHCEIYQSCEKIWDHNQQHLSNRSFFIDPLKLWLKNYIPDITITA
jgi:hypothetical protein